MDGTVELGETVFTVVVLTRQTTTTSGKAGGVRELTIYTVRAVRKQTLLVSGGNRRVNTMVTAIDNRSKRHTVSKHSLVFISGFRVTVTHGYYSYCGFQTRN